MCIEDRPKLKPVVFVETVSVSAAGVNTFQCLVFERVHDQLELSHMISRDRVQRAETGARFTT